MKQYILDSNIVIQIWKEYPHLLTKMEKSGLVEFSISNDIAKELSQKECKNFNGIQVLSDKFLKLLNHIINNPIKANNLIMEKIDANIKFNNVTKMYSINNNKISSNDFNLLLLCKINIGYILVTSDIRLYNSAKVVLEKNKVLRYEEFISEIKTIICIR